MRKAITLLFVIVGGCFYLGKDQIEEVLERPVTQWSSRDCLIVMLSSMQNNLNDRDGANIEVIATPYTPVVIAAINRISQAREHWSDHETQNKIDTSLFFQAGLFLDWQTNQLMDTHGNYLGNTGRFDKLQFLVTLRNKTWPCIIPRHNVRYGGTYVDQPIATPADWPCYVPDITDLDQRISLTNDNGLRIKPKYVFGRRNNNLTTEETLVVPFELYSGDLYLFDGSKNISLVIEGFEFPVKFTFPIASFFRIPVSPIKTTVQTQ
jgi:hypothetical protein